MTITVIIWRHASAPSQFQKPYIYFESNDLELYIFENQAQNINEPGLWKKAFKNNLLFRWSIRCP